MLPTAADAETLEHSCPGSSARIPAVSAIQPSAGKVPDSARPVTRIDFSVATGGLLILPKIPAQTRLNFQFANRPLLVGV
jgi:hypothetical protein